MYALDAGEIYSLMMNNLLFEATIWLAGKHQRKTLHGAAAPDPQSNISSVHKVRRCQCLCSRGRGRRDTEINIQRKRENEQPPSILGRLGCS